MSQENIKLYSSKFELCESESDPDVYLGRFIICDFSPNKNGLQLDRNTIEQWLSTLIDKPLVGRIVTTLDGTKDFSGHNMKVIKEIDDFGNEYETVEFDTSAWGTFCQVGIEEIDGVEYIVATAKIWKRFTEACSVIKSRVENGGLSTSFEITVLKSRVANYMGKPLKIVEQGCFFGHCLLGASVTPAFSNSKLLDVASKEIDNDLEKALINDIYQLAQKEEENNVNKTDITASEAKPENTGAEKAIPGSAEVAALTEYDLRDKLRDACRAKLGKWCWIFYHFPADMTVWVEAEYRESELDYIMFTYTVENDTVTVSEPMPVKLSVSIAQLNPTIEKLNADLSARDTTIITLNSKIQALSTEISTLNTYKEKFEQIEQEKIAHEIAQKKESLKNKILQSKTMTAEEIETSEQIKNMLESMDENGINKLIADKVISSVTASKQSKKIETAQVQTQPTVRTNIADSDEFNMHGQKVTPKEFVHAFIKG